MAEKKNRVRLPEKPCYPKHLVYPENGREVCLEQIRARLPQYRQVESDLGIDMDMTEVVGVGNITEQVPLLPSLDRGKRVLKPKTLEANVDDELEQLNREKPLILSASHPKPVRHLPEELDPDRELEQLMLEKESFPRPSGSRALPPKTVVPAPVAIETTRDVCSQAPSTMGKGLLNTLMEKENAPMMIKGDFYGFTPSATSNAPVPQGYDSRLPSIMAKLSFSDASMSNQSAVTHDLLEERQSSQLQVMMDWERKAKLTSEQQDFEAQFLCGYTEFETKASSVSQRPKARQPLQLLETHEQFVTHHQDPKSFAVLEDTASGAGHILNKHERQPLRVIESHETSVRDDPSAISRVHDASSFSIFQDPSRSSSHFSRHGRQPLQVIESHETSVRDEPSGLSRVHDASSFSVFQDPSRSASNFFKQENSIPLALKSIVDKENPTKSSVQPTLNSFSVFEDPSIADLSKQQSMRVPLALKSIVDKENPTKNSVQPTLNSFSVFEDPSIADLSKQQSMCKAGEPNLTSFSVYEDPSITNVSRQQLPHNTAHSTVTSVNCHGDAGVSNYRNKESHRHPLAVLKQEDSHTNALPAALSDQQQLPHLEAGQEMTQFDIHPASKFEPTSTPCASHKAAVSLGVDFSVNLTSISILQPDPCPKPSTNVQPAPAPIPARGSVVPIPPPSQEFTAMPSARSEFTYNMKPLDTIQEESRSSYGTASTSSGSSGNSKLASSSMASTPGGGQPLLGIQELRRWGVKVNDCGHINPFLPETIEFMLYSLPITSTKICHANSSSSRFVIGSKIELCGIQHHIQEKLAKGGFASIFVASTDEGLKVLKVQSPPHSWEVAVLEEVHRLLRANHFPDVAQSIMQVEYVKIFSNSSVIVSPYHSFGTLLDLTNKHRTAKKHVNEVIAIYYALELLHIVEALHSCNILHADIKPDNIMLRDTRQYSSYEEARGHGLCLVDFGRAIDMNRFPRGTQFVGSCDTDGFLCPEMQNEEPWTWQADLYGTAASIYILLAKEYMKLSKNPVTGMYQPLMSLSRLYNKKYWEKVFTLLLNAKGTDHAQDISAIIEQLSTQSDLLHKSFKTGMDRMWLLYI